MNYYDQANQLSDIKESRTEFTDIHSQVLQDILKRVDKTFKSFFSRVKKGVKAGFPRFKGKNWFDSFCYPQSGFRLDGNSLFLSKIGKIKIHLSQNMLGKVKTCTIKKEVSGWFVIFTVETPKEPLPKTGLSVGIDMGISLFATLSNGTNIDNFKYFESTQAKLRVKQRSVARKARSAGSQSRRKAVIQLRKVHQKIKNQRNDFQHKVSTHLVKEFDLIAIEKLSILGMSRGVLSKQIMDASWSSFFQMLKYKAESADKRVMEVNPNYTSQDCSQCGNRVKKDLSEREHHCLQCGLKLDRDVNASINILGLGLSLETLTYGNGHSVVSESPTAA